MHTTNRTLAFTLFVAALLVPFILLFGKPETMVPSWANAPATEAHAFDDESKSETPSVSENYCLRLLTKIVRETFSIYDPDQIYWEWVNLQEFNLNFGESSHSLGIEWSDDNLLLYGSNMYDAKGQKSK